MVPYGRLNQMSQTALGTEVKPKFKKTVRRLASPVDEFLRQHRNPDCGLSPRVLDVCGLLPARPVHQDEAQRKLSLVGQVPFRLRFPHFAAILLLVYAMLGLILQSLRTSQYVLSFSFFTTWVTWPLFYTVLENVTYFVVKLQTLMSPLFLIAIRYAQNQNLRRRDEGAKRMVVSDLPTGPHDFGGQSRAL